jgi:hypothetical protein
LWKEAAMRQPSVYVALDGREICLEHLDAQERKLLAAIRRRARTHPDWDAFDNYSFRAILKFYEARGVPPKESRYSILFRIALDLSGRIAVAAGWARLPDYKDDLEDLIREQFASQRAFCKATGLAEDMLSHVLAGRKDLSLAALTKALERIGYTLRILPQAPGETQQKALPKGGKRRPKSA